MSTEHQDYSLSNQASAIHQFAECHGYEVVKTYADPAKSGVVIRNRPALRQLLEDVVDGTAPYKTVLVYDVSRWGRFQDKDEAACYEFLCRRFGVTVRYCAESFIDDDSTASSVLKHLRRVMAAEFSRDLGSKVFGTKARYARMGFWVGGPAPYGLCRVMVSADGRQLRTLLPGERKSDSSCRVILVPGPREEVDRVKAMFAMVLKCHLGCVQVARELNLRGWTNRGKRWRPDGVRKILANPLYAGCNTWNRVSRRLKTRQIKVPPDKWIRCPDAFQSIVDDSSLERISKVFRRRLEERSWVGDSIVRKLRRILARKGRLSETVLAADLGAPSPNMLRNRYGSCIAAYKLAGYDVPLTQVKQSAGNRRTRLLLEQVAAQLIAASRREITCSRKGNPFILSLHNGVHVRLVVARSIPSPTTQPRWVIDRRADAGCPVLLVNLNGANNGFHSLYVFAHLEMPTYRRFGEDASFLKGARRLENLSHFYELVKSSMRDVPCFRRQISDVGQLFPNRDPGET